MSPRRLSGPAPRPAARTQPTFAGLLNSSAAFVAVLVAATLVAAVVGTGVTAAPAVPGVSTPSGAVRFAIPVAKAVLDIGAVAAAGLALLAKFLGYDRPAATEPVMRRARRWAVWASVVWATGAFTSIVLLAWEIEAGFPGPGRLWSYLVNVGAGKGLLLSGICALVSIVLAALAVRRGERVPAELRAGVVLFGLLPIPLTGHASVGRWHDLSVVSMELHVVAATAWAGGLATIVIFLATDRRLLADAVPRFSRLATWCVVVVGVTGVFSGLVELAISPVTQLPGNLFDTRYGVLLLTKAALMGLVAVTASVVRYRLLPAVAGGRRSAFAVWCGWELIVLALAFGVAVVLTRAPVTPF